MNGQILICSPQRFCALQSSKINVKNNCGCMLSDELELKCTASDPKNCSMWSSVYAMWSLDCDNQSVNTKLIDVC